MNSKQFLALRNVVMLLALGGAAAGSATTWAAPAASQDVTVSGAVKKPLDLTVDDLKAFAGDELGTVVLNRHVDGKDAPATFRGVRLTAVLDRAALLERDHNDWKHAVVLATATDGYQVVFSWPELVNTAVGKAVLVVFERDGQALADDEGRIALVSGQDTRTGPRHVRWLSRLEVRILKD